MNSINIRKLTLTALLAFGATQAHAEIAVIVNPKHPAASMTAEQVANVYLGKDTSFAPADQPEASAVRGGFYTKVAGKDAAQVKAIWARLIFTGKVQPPKELKSDADVKAFVAGDAKAIGYVDASAVDGSVKAVLKL